MLLTPDIQDCIARSVLCWLATVDADGRPNVSPKEIYAAFDDSHLVIAHIASPTSVRNIGANPVVCVSFVDVFVQKGWKLHGEAEVVPADDPRFAVLARPLAAMTGGKFPIHAVIDVRVTAAAPIVAPSYRLVPGTTEASQVAAAMATYGVVPRAGMESPGA